MIATAPATTWSLWSGAVRGEMAKLLTVETSFNQLSIIYFARSDTHHKLVVHLADSLSQYLADCCKCLVRVLLVFQGSNTMDLNVLRDIIEICKFFNQIIFEK